MAFQRGYKHANYYGYVLQDPVNFIDPYGLRYRTNSNGRNNPLSYNSTARRGPILRNDYRTKNHSEPSSNSPLRPRSDIHLRNESQRQSQRETLREFYEKTLQNLDVPEKMFPSIPDFDELYPKWGFCPIN